MNIPAGWLRSECSCRLVKDESIFCRLAKAKQSRTVAEKRAVLQVR